MSKKIPQTKKEKQYAKNKRDRNIFLMADQAREQVDIAAPQVEVAEAAPSGDGEVWSAKVQMIKNKTTGRRRKATDRWNRFAGASGGTGGRGR